MSHKERPEQLPGAEGAAAAEAAAEPTETGAAEEAKDADNGADEAARGQTAKSPNAEKESADAASEEDDGQDHVTGEPTEAGEGAAVRVETRYEQVAAGHRVTRRTVRRKQKTSREYVEETITEDLPIPVYGTPSGAPHPAPVG